MGVKGKKCKFASEVDIFAKDAENKCYIWASAKMGCRKSKGKKKKIIHKKLSILIKYFVRTRF